MANSHGKESSTWQCGHLGQPTELPAVDINGVAVDSFAVAGGARSIANGKPINWLQKAQRSTAAGVKKKQITAKRTKKKKLFVVYLNLPRKKKQ